MRTVLRHKWPATLCALSMGLALGIYAPSAAHAVEQDGPIACTSLPTFYPNNGLWPGIWVEDTAQPENSGYWPIIFRQTAAGSADIGGSDSEQWSIFNAFNVWNGVQCGGAWPRVFALDGHRYEIGDPAQPILSADYPTADSGDSPTGQYYQNIIYFVESGWGAGPGTLAVTLTSHTPYTQYMVEADMAFNGEGYRWRARPTPTGAFEGCSTGTDCYDVGDVALHEAGHFFGFHHVLCADAIMYPSGTADAQRTELSVHEIEGMCALYEMRPDTVTCAAGTNCRAFGEQCESDDQCMDGLCITDGDNGRTVFATSIRDLYDEDLFYPMPWTYCSKPCTTHSDCPKAYLCRDNGAGDSFCGPGPNLTGSGEAPGTDCFCDSTQGVCDTDCACDAECEDNNVGGGGGDEPVVGASDFCSVCTAGPDCQTGLCVAEAGEDAGICTASCLDDSGCPTGFACTDFGGFNVCYPESAAVCGGTTNGVGVNQICYVENAESPENSYFNPCAAGLSCIGFQTACAVSQRGECVNYCNASDSPCAEGLTCCFGVDEFGRCIRNSTEDSLHGGCFNLREEGESCFVAENSVCDNGGICLTFEGLLSFSKCYRECDGSCGGSASCTPVTLSNGDGEVCASGSVCCDTEGLEDGKCIPGTGRTGYELGVLCQNNSDCDSGLCLSFEGTRACSRECNPITGVGCPGDIDVNEDGVLDGGFTCRSTTGGGRCWPRRGPADPPPEPATPAPIKPGCCDAMGAGQGALAMNLLPWLGILFAHGRRRRRVSK